MLFILKNLNNSRENLNVPLEFFNPPLKKNYDNFLSFHFIRKKMSQHKKLIRRNSKENVLSPTPLSLGNFLLA